MAARAMADIAKIHLDCQKPRTALPLLLQARKLAREAAAPAVERLILLYLSVTLSALAQQGSAELAALGASILALRHGMSSEVPRADPARGLVKSGADAEVLLSLDRVLGAADEA
jgi:hypothetical protein